MASTLIRSRSLLSPKCTHKFKPPLSHNASTLPLTIQPSQSEIKNGNLDSRNLESAIHSLHSDGLVIISNIIPHKDLDHLNTKMIQDARTLQARGKNMPYNYNVGNIQQDPPPTLPYFHKSIFLNKIASQITSNVLGPRPKWTFCSGNTALPPQPGAKSQRQPVHSDADFAHPTAHPFGLVINVPLITFTPENGSTEIWLGTHTNDLSVQEGAHGERASGRIRQDLLDQRRKIRGPSQPMIEKGSIVIRDLRLWHAGMPNWTEDVRVMLAMIHFAPWYRNQMKLELSEDVKEVVEQEGGALEVPVDWVSEREAKERYLNRGFGNSYDFNQVP